MWKNYQPVEIVFGEGERRNIGKYLEEKNIKRAFLITGKSMVKYGFADQLIKDSHGRIIGKSCDVEPDAAVHNVDRNADLVRASGADGIVAMGGGSTIDCSKCVSVSVADHCTGDSLLKGHKVAGALPVVAIPTTAGSGSELTPAAGLCNKEKGIRGGIFSRELYPVLAVIDPQLTCSAPRSVTVHTGFDVIAHALDVLSSSRSNPYTEVLAVKAAKIAIANLEQAALHGEDPLARGNMCVASIMAGSAFSQIGTGASHACAAALAQRYDIPHGEACAFTLDVWLPLNAEIYPKLHQRAREIGFEDAFELSGRIRQLQKTLGISTHLSDFGGDRPGYSGPGKGLSGEPKYEK